MRHAIHAYHVSALPLHAPGTDRASLSPRTPESGEERLSHIRRICVAPTPAQCLCALGMRLYITPWFYVYRTVQPVIVSPSQDVHDSVITEEGWLYETTEFQLVARLPRASFDEFVVMSDDNEDRLDVDLLTLSLDHRGRPETLDRQREELERTRVFLRQHWDAFTGFARRDIEGRRTPSGRVAEDYCSGTEPPPTVAPAINTPPPASFPMLEIHLRW